LRKEQANHVQLLVAVIEHGGVVERCPTARFNIVDSCCLVREKETRDLQTTHLGRLVKRRTTTPVDDVDLHVWVREEEAHDFHVSGPRCVVETCASAVIVPCIDVEPRTFQQTLDVTRIAGSTSFSKLKRTPHYE
jgi:hypothetical protein